MALLYHILNLKSRERNNFYESRLVRVSTAEQNMARQEVLMKQLGVEKVYIDKISGKSANYPQLRKMMFFVQNSDTVLKLFHDSREIQGIYSTPFQKCKEKYQNNNIFYNEYYTITY
ncbi:MAG: recombinase family protein, partial [Oscillospiraceae bacterium]|nr:recombinase family protein [Oscillospiraceae bacterium]